mgnify:CR=1 FL=1
MTKSELIEKIATRYPHVSLKDAEVIVKTIFGTLADALKKGERIEIRGFGSFQIRVRKAREGRNPKSGQIAHIPEKRVPFFKVGKTLKERVNISPLSPQAQQNPPQEQVKTEEKT